MPADKSINHDLTQIRLSLHKVHQSLDRVCRHFDTPAKPSLCISSRMMIVISAITPTPDYAAQPRKTPYPAQS